jgi:hypothetical protein
MPATIPSSSPPRAAPVLLRLELGIVRADRDVQARAGLDPLTVSQYAAALQAEVILPPVVVFFDGTEYWLGDGFHRHAAHVQAGKDVIKSRVYQGSREDAAWFACGANKEFDTGGLRLTNEDKQRAVRAALRLRPGLSDRLLADHCGVSHVMVWKVRGEVLSVNTCPGGGPAAPEVHQGRDGKHYPAHRSEGARPPQAAGHAGQAEPDATADSTPEAPADSSTTDGTPEAPRRPGTQIGPYYPTAAEHAVFLRQVKDLKRRHKLTVIQIILRGVALYHEESCHD